jgi:uncharacterized protein (DUF1800 family)
MHRKQLKILLVVLALAVSASVWAGNKKKDKKPVVAPEMEERQRALQALNRLTFGPRPGEVDRVTAMGVDKWFEQQLHPEKIDDSALAARLEPLRTLRMDARQLVENFPPPQLIKQVADGRRSMPSDKTERAIYESQVEKYRDKQEKKAAEPADQAGDNQGMMLTDEQKAERREARMYAREQVDKILTLPTPDQRMQAILAMDPQRRQMLVRALNPEERQQLMDSLTPQQREQVMAMNNPPQVVATELMQGKVLRAAYSERQLDEVMTDFWFNHFNVFVNKGADRFLLTSYERDVIRAHALGRFEDLLVATAQSPAMLFYLDNWLSVGPNSEVGLGIAPRGRRRGQNRRAQYRPPPKGKARLASGLNENYGRELMELHTLSVNGGYTQNDVTEVAKVFTGWTIEQPRNGGGFCFEPRMHEPGTKTVLGHKIKENGEQEGLEVLRMLARNPKTAHFISQKLAMRFVSDDPPPALVDRMTQTFLKKRGDIREVLRTMFSSPEFWAPETYRAKVKTPLEFVVSAVRASEAQVDDTRALIGTLNNMGMMPYGMQPPTGYSMKADTWVNSSALLGRMNFALGLAAGKVRGVSVDPAQLAAGATDAQQALAALETLLLAGEVSKQTHETISKQLDDPQISQRRLDDGSRPPNLAAITGLILGSPEFQRR